MSAENTSHFLSSVQILTILVAIPTVIMALWADHFAKEISQRKPAPDPEEVLTTIQQMKVGAYLGLGLLFVLTSEERAQIPALSLVIFFTAIGLQSQILFSLSNRFKKPETEPVGSTIQLASRSAFWALSSIAIYLGTLFLANLGSFILAQALHFSPTAIIASLMVGNAIGVLAGLGLTFGLAPSILRGMIPCEAITSTFNFELHERIRNCFEKAQLKAPSAWLMRYPRASTTNALVAGFYRGRGIFSPGIFLTPSLLEHFTVNEQEAVLLHEVSHLSLSHLRKRLLLSLGAVLASAAVSVIVLMAAYLTLPTAVARSGGVCVPLIVFLFAFRKIQKQLGAQEFEADAHAVNRLGANRDSLVSALRKMNLLNGLTDARKAVGFHPSTEERIVKLQLATDAHALVSEWSRKDAA